MTDRQFDERSAGIPGRREYPKKVYTVLNTASAPRILNVVSKTGNGEQLVVRPGETVHGVRMQKDPEDMTPKKRRGVMFTEMSAKEAKAVEEGGETDAERKHREEVEGAPAPVRKSRRKDHDADVEDELLDVR